MNLDDATKKALNMATTAAQAAAPRDPNWWRKIAAPPPGPPDIRELWKTLTPRQLAALGQKIGEDKAAQFVAAMLAQEQGG